MDSQVHNAAHVDKTNGNVPLGSVMHDTGKITGGLVSGLDPAAITFKYYANGTCAGDGSAVANTGADEGDASRDRSAASAALAAGPHSYKAFVAGNDNYLGTDSGCEPFTVDKANPAIATIVKDSAGNTIDNDHPGAAGITSIHDTATLTGQVNTFSPAGTLTYRFFSTNNCTGTATSQNVNVSSAGIVPDSSAQTLAAGSYSYQATYNGNVNYSTVTGACEPFRIVPPTGKITPTQTTCEQFRSGTNDDLTDEFYVTKAGKINGISPGVFFYYSKITAPASNFTIRVMQSNLVNQGNIPSWRPIETMQIILWDANCVKTSATGTTDPTTGNVTITATGLTTGAVYYVSVKYDPGSLATSPGQVVGTGNPKPTAIYTFQTWLPAGFIISSQDSVSIKPK